MQKLIRFFLPLLIILSVKGYGQDEHFTNFRMAPLAVNPALTGAFNGTYRLTAVYRGQWNTSSLGKGIRQPHVSVDIPMLAGILTENDWIGVGLSVLTSISGQHSFRSGFAGTSATYHLGLDANYSRVFSVGFQYGQANSRIGDKSNIRTPSVLFGQQPENLTSANEGLGTNSVSGGSYGIGITYKATLNDNGDLWRAGLAMRGIGSSRGTFVQSMAGQDTTNINPGFNTSLERGPTLTGTFEASFMRSEKVRINPALIFEQNKNATNLSVQATADYLLSAAKRQIITGGLGYRVGESVHVLAGMQIKDIRVGLAYDIPVQGVAVTNPVGAFEISVGYIGKIFKKPQPDNKILCPRL